MASFFSGIGPANISFDENSIQSFRLSQTPEFQRITKLFFEKNNALLASGSDWTGINGTGFGKTISFLEGIQIALDSPTGALAGTFTALRIAGGPNRSLAFTLSNDTSLQSLTGRLLGNISINRSSPYFGSPGSTVSQTFKINQTYKVNGSY